MSGSRYRIALRVAPTGGRHRLPAATWPPLASCGFPWFSISFRDFPGLLVAPGPGLPVAGALREASRTPRRLLLGCCLAVAWLLLGCCLAPGPPGLFTSGHGRPSVRALLLSSRPRRSPRAPRRARQAQTNAKRTHAPPRLIGLAPLPMEHLCEARVRTLIVWLRRSCLATGCRCRTRL